MSITSSIDPSPWFHQMRVEKPVYFDPDQSLFFGAKGVWQAFRYQDVHWGLSDHSIFSNEYIPKIPGEAIGNSLGMTDPPRHRQLRELVSKAFAPSVIQRLEEWLYGYCEKKIRTMIASGSADFIRDFANLLSATVIAQMLGIPETYHQQINTWTSALISDPGVIGPEAYGNAQQEMGRLFMGLLQERAQHPQEDLITHLLQAEIDGEKLGTGDLLSFCAALLLAGAESTDGLLGNAMLTFIEHPTIQEHLIRHPADIPKAMAEVLRFRGPVMSIPRIIKQDVELGGSQLQKGELINLWMGAANRDPSVFAEPDKFDMHRDNTKILSFGHGIHYCLGAFLAKLESRVAFETVFRHMQDIRLAPGAVISRAPSVVVFKFASLPIIFQRRDDSTSKPRT